MRHFNTDGPVDALDHYCVPPLSRIDLAQILALIEWKKYFVLHGPRQTGKTSTLIALQDLLNEEGRYRCLYVNVENAQTARDDVARGMLTILGKIGSSARDILQDDFVDSNRRRILEDYGPDGAFSDILARWSAASAKPLVLLIDEIDSVIGDTLISLLRQLRSEYHRRPGRFPQSVVLCGVRDVRDYRIYSSRQGTQVTGGSAFNIKAESLRLGDFSEPEVRALLAQHASDTGQQFEEAALNRVWYLTRGQPYLVNALAQRACFKDPSGRDRANPIRRDAIDSAKERMILDRVTHLDQLTDKLREERVRRVIEPLLAGTAFGREVSEDDLDYVADLGLVRVDQSVEISNPIYREVVPRQLTWVAERSIVLETAWYVRPDGSLDVPRLLAAFQAYFRENAEQWPDRFMYKEAGPHLLLQTYLQRVVNGGGRLEREYGLGRGRTDILVLWPQGTDGDPGQVRKHVIECKVARKGRGPESAIREGLRQTAAYMDRCGAESGHLVVFDAREGRSWEERLYRREEKADGKVVTVWGA